MLPNWSISFLLYYLFTSCKWAAYYCCFTTVTTSPPSSALSNFKCTSTASSSSSFFLILFTCWRRRSQYNLSSDIFVFSASVFSCSSATVTNKPTFREAFMIFYTTVTTSVSAICIVSDFNTFFSLCSIVCQTRFGWSQCHQPLLPLCCIDSSEVKVLLSGYSQVNSCRVWGMN